MAESDIRSPPLQITSTEKTPIQILHEYGIKIGNLPVYVIEGAEGEAHQPNFTYKVTISDVSCTGQGFTKKAAMHQAAEAALRVLEISADTFPQTQKTESKGYGADTSDQANPVGILQELAMQRAWHLPEYIVDMEAGPAHKKEFTVTCRLENLSETGMASSKKTAKRAAAEKILEKMQRLSGGSSEITWTPKPSVYLENLRDSSKEKISLLRMNPLSIPNTDYIQMLLNLSQEQGFEVTYYDIDELTVNGQYQCLAQLSTTPVTVCHGTGISCSNAHNDAAHHALQYIKIMASMA